jgi:hypothetical protein
MTLKEQARLMAKAIAEGPKLADRLTKRERARINAGWRVAMVHDALDTLGKNQERTIGLKQ